MRGGRVTKCTIGDPGLNEGIRAPGHGDMAVVCGGEDWIMVRRGHLVFGWRRPKTARQEGGCVGQRSLLHLLQAQRRRDLSGQVLEAQ